MKDVGKIFLVFFCLLMADAYSGNNRTYQAVILQGGNTTAVTPDAAIRLIALAEKAGYRVRHLSLDGICQADNLKGCDLLLLPDSATLPGASIPVIQHYLKTGGDLIALNTPLWQHFLVKDPGTGKWIEQDKYRAGHIQNFCEHPLFSFGSLDLSGWQRSSNDMQSAVHFEQVKGPAPETGALHVTIENLSGWDNLRSPVLKKPFRDGETLTVFTAKGGPRTSALAIEWDEEDGSRWIATVPLTRQWQQYVLAPEDFHFWESVPSRTGTSFQPKHAVALVTGLAFTHTGMTGGHHEYWISEIGTASRNPRYEPYLVSYTVPALDTLCPGYKFFTSHHVQKIQWNLVGNRHVYSTFDSPLDIRSVQPRPSAGGFGKGRSWRWEALAISLAPSVSSSTLQWRGTPLSLFVNTAGPYKGGVWVSCATSDQRFYAQESLWKCLQETINRIKRGIFLIDGGANYYTYFHGQEMVLGVRLINTGKEAVHDLNATITCIPSNGEEVIKKQWKFHQAPGEIRVCSARCLSHAGEINVTIQHKKKIIDQVAHQTAFWQPSHDFITVKDGHFIKDGKPWRPHGVNYMPSSGIGTEDWEYFEFWVGKEAYDPEIIERDLEHIKEIGLNSVSIFIYHRSMKSQNLLDLLRRLRILGLRANLSLRPGTPMDFQWDKIRDLIQYYHLRDEATVYAFDLAWEPMFHDHKDRQKWDAAWREWVTERYGSLQNAEKDWQFRAPRDRKNRLTNPLGPMLVTDGPWNKMVAAYRRFLDTLLYAQYNHARELVHSIDPHHLVSFRMTLGGDPTCRATTLIPYDYPYLAGAVDIMEPEGYGRIGDWDRVKPGWFQRAYARWAAPHLPMIWAEAGVSTWSSGEHMSPPEQLKWQADFYNDMYRMIINSHADGVYWWWYPGGYRVNERSDYGIINPDGTDRPVTRVIRDHIHSLRDNPYPGPINKWLTFDRDAHPDGVAGIYDTLKKDFWNAVQEGETPGLRTKGAGTNSRNCPLVAVGNTRCNGTNPPKYLDAFFNSIAVQDGPDHWNYDGEIHLSPGTPVKIRITLTNLNEATWLSPQKHKGRGCVYLTWHGDCGTGEIPIPADMKRFDQDTIEFTLTNKAPRQRAHIYFRLVADSRTPFGPCAGIILYP